MSWMTITSKFARSVPGAPSNTVFAWPPSAVIKDPEWFVSMPRNIAFTAASTEEMRRRKKIDKLIGVGRIVKRTCYLSIMIVSLSV